MLLLPTYNGNYKESFEKFICSFEAVLSTHDYGDYEKFLLLKKNVHGRAATLLESLELDKQSFGEAKKLLQLAFASPIVQRYNALQRLIDLNSSSDADPLYIVSEMRQVCEMFRVLKIDTNMVLQFFYWRALPECIKEHLIHITNSSKPTLEEIENNIFAAIDRAQNEAGASQKYLSSSTKVNNYALNVKFKNDKSKLFDNCTLCGESHPYFKCSKYITVKEKLKRLEAIEGCVKCGSANHKIGQCKTQAKCKRM